MSAASTDTPPASPPSHATIALLAAAAFFSGGALRICDGLLPRLARDFAMTPGAAGRVMITFSIAYGAMQLVFGPLGDRFGKARLVLFALVGCAAMATASALAPGFDTLLVARVGWGMAAAGVIPLAMAWIGDAVPYEQRQATLARLLLGTLSGMMAGQLAGGLFGDSRLGWRGAFFAMAAGYAFIAALLFVRLRRAGAGGPAAAHARFATQVKAVLGTRWSHAVLGSALVEGIFLLGPMAYLPSMLHGRFDIAISAASGLVALYAVGGLVYAITAKAIVRRFGERRMVNAGGWIMGLGYLAWWASPVVWTAGPVALLVGFGTYLFHNTLQTNATQMAPTARGTGVALFASCFFVGQAIGVTLAGWAFDHAGAAALLLPPAFALPLAGLAFARAPRARDAARA
jgi:predicted MFS family arabinose efflux permease